MNKSIILLLIISLTACYSPPENQSNELGGRNIGYYSNKSVAELEVPPDLTKPNQKNSLDLSEVVKDIDIEYAEFSKINDTKSAGKYGLSVKKKGDVRWLTVKKSIKYLWPKIIKFLKKNNFAIEKSNKQTGIMETDFLENKPDVPEQSLGLFRSLFNKISKGSYSTGVVDKYRVRFESVNNSEETEIFLTLISMEEVVTTKGTDNEKTIWQTREKDVGLELEMLYRLMLFLGTSSGKAKDKIVNATEIKGLNVNLDERLGGQVNLIFPLGFKETWQQLSWALDQLDISVADKNIIEGAIYIDMKDSKNEHLVNTFNKDIMKHNYQLLLKPVKDNETRVSLNTINANKVELDLQNAREFLGKIAKTF